MSERVHTLLALNDEVLRPLLQAPDEAARHSQIEVLVGVRARATIHRVLAKVERGTRPLFAEDAADVTSAVMIRLIHKLHALLDSADDAIRDYDNYVARLTFNAVHDLWRVQNPERTRLKRRFRYALTADPRLATWDSPTGPLGGLAGWRDSTDHLRTPPEFPPDASELLFDTNHPADALVEFFRLAGAPMLLDDITATFAERWRVTESPSHPPVLADNAPDQLTVVAARQQLQFVWEEICDLPAPQRAALLLNLRDAIGLNATALFPLTGVATLDDVARNIGVTSQELVRIWNDLPMPDNDIAELLKTTRQSVINLRKSARERLYRRMARRQGGAAGKK